MWGGWGWYWFRSKGWSNGRRSPLTLKMGSNWKVGKIRQGCHTWIYFTEHLVRFSLFLVLENKFFLPSFPFFEFTRTMFSSLLSTIYIWNTVMSCSIPFQELYKVYFYVPLGYNTSYIRFLQERVFISPWLVARRLDSLWSHRQTHTYI